MHLKTIIEIREANVIPQIQPWIDESELVELKRVISSTFVVESELTKEFEDMTRQMTGAKHAIAYTNGTLALYGCFKSLGIGPGDEVIVPNLTFIATANAVLMAGAKPVFCEVTSDTFCIDPKQLGQHLSSRTKAVVPVHLYGQSADMEQIASFCKKNNLFLVEDAAQGVGVKFQKKHVGTFGQLGILSYYGNKTITCGEGGIVLTDDDSLAKEIYRLKNHGREKKGVFIHEHIGFNFSFTEMQAAIGISQMKKLDRIIQKKNMINKKYIDAFSGLSGIKNVFIDPRCEPVFWFTSIMTENADKLANYLLKHEIQTRRFFLPLHIQPCYKDLLITTPFLTSEKIYQQGLSLPSSYSLTDTEQAFVIQKIQDFSRESCA